MRRETFHECIFSGKACCPQHRSITTINSPIITFNNEDIMDDMIFDKDLFGEYYRETLKQIYSKSVNGRRSGYRTADLVMNKYTILNQLSYTTDAIPIPIVSPTVVTELPERNITFSKCIGAKDHNQLVHFFESDIKFARFLHNPTKYGKILKRYPVVVGPDLSQKIGYPPFVCFENSWWNKALTAYLQHIGVKTIPNVCWSLPASYSYAFLGHPKHSVIAINSTGIISNPVSLYLWRKGYDEALNRL